MISNLQTASVIQSTVKLKQSLRTLFTDGNEQEKEQTATRKKSWNIFTVKNETTLRIHAYESQYKY